jgi:hypothetical protein
MKARILTGTIAALALGTAGIAVAEGTSGQTRDTSAHEMQQSDQSTTGTPQGSETGTAGVETGTETGTESQQQAGRQTQTGEIGQTKTGIDRLDSVKLSVLDEDQAQNLQTKLQELGYYKAEVDGKIGPKTRAALSQFFRDQAQLVNRGRLSELSMTSLGFDDSEIERVRGMEEEPAEQQRAPTRGVEEDEPIEGTSPDVAPDTEGTGTQQSPGSQGTMPDVEP